MICWRRRISASIRWRARFSARMSRLLPSAARRCWRSRKSTIARITPFWRLRVSLTWRRFARWRSGCWAAGTRRGRRTSPRRVEGTTPRVLTRKKDIEQVHICLAFPGVEQDDEELYPISVMNNLFGGGMSSRLFQRIREEMGAAYSVYSFPSTYTNCGTFTVYAGTSPETAQKVADELHNQIRLLRDGGVTQEEFDMAKEQLKVSYVLGLESSSSRMSAIGRSKLAPRPRRRSAGCDPQD